MRFLAKYLTISILIVCIGNQMVWAQGDMLRPLAALEPKPTPRQNGDDMTDDVIALFRRRLAGAPATLAALQQRMAELKMRVIKGNPFSRQQLEGAIPMPTSPIITALSYATDRRGAVTGVSQSWLYCTIDDLDARPDAYLAFIHEIVESSIHVGTLIELARQGRVINNQTSQQLIQLDYPHALAHIEVFEHSDEYSFNNDERFLNALMFFRSALRLIQQERFTTLFQIFGNTAQKAHYNAMLTTLVAFLNEGAGKKVIGLVVKCEDPRQYNNDTRRFIASEKDDIRAGAERFLQLWKGPRPSPGLAIPRQRARDTGSAV